jgi:glutathione S-transferase
MRAPVSERLAANVLGSAASKEPDMTAKLYYSHSLNPRVAVAAARYLHAPVEYVRASPRHPDNIEAFRAINPNALVPVLVEGEARLWETDAIVCRLSERAGSDFWRTGADMAEMILWISWSAYHLTRAADPLYFYRIVWPTLSDETPDPAVLDKALRDFRTHAATLDAHLAGRTWVLGDEISYADFRVATALPFADGAGLPVADFPNVQRWHERLWAIDAWREPFRGLD